MARTAALAVRSDEGSDGEGEPSEEEGPTEEGKLGEEEELAQARQGSSDWVAEMEANYRTECPRPAARRAEEQAVRRAKEEEAKKQQPQQQQAANKRSSRGQAPTSADEHGVPSADNGEQQDARASAVEPSRG